MSSPSPAARAFVDELHKRRRHIGEVADLFDTHTARLRRAATNTGAEGLKAVIAHYTPTD